MQVQRESLGVLLKRQGVIRADTVVSDKTSFPSSLHFLPAPPGLECLKPTLANMKNEDSDMFLEGKVSIEKNLFDYLSARIEIGRSRVLPDELSNTRIIPIQSSHQDRDDTKNDLIVVKNGEKLSIKDQEAIFNFQNENLYVETMRRVDVQTGLLMLSRAAGSSFAGLDYPNHLLDALDSDSRESLASLVAYESEFRMASKSSVDPTNHELVHLFMNNGAQTIFAIKSAALAKNDNLLSLIIETNKYHMDAFSIRHLIELAFTIESPLLVNRLVDALRIPITCQMIRYSIDYNPNITINLMGHTEARRTDIEAAISFASLKHKTLLHLYLAASRRNVIGSFFLHNFLTENQMRLQVRDRGSKLIIKSFFFESMEKPFDIYPFQQFVPLSRTFEDEFLFSNHDITLDMGILEPISNARLSISLYQSDMLTEGVDIMMGMLDREDNLSREMIEYIGNESLAIFDGLFSQDYSEMIGLTGSKFKKECLIGCPRNIREFDGNSGAVLNLAIIVLYKHYESPHAFDRLFWRIMMTGINLIRLFERLLKTGEVELASHLYRILPAYKHEILQYIKWSILKDQLKVKTPQARLFLQILLKSGSFVSEEIKSTIAPHLARMRPLTSKKPKQEIKKLKPIRN